MADSAADSYHIGLNALLLSPGQATYRSAGIHNYMSGLLPHLPTADDRFTYTAFVVGDQPGLDSTIRQQSAGSRLSPLARIAWEQFAQPVLGAHVHLQLLHSMAFVSPLITTTPSVVTVYDLSFHRMPNRFQRSRRAYLSIFTRLSCRRARRIIAISKHTKKDIVSVFNVPSDRIDVVYPGCDSLFQRVGEKAVSEFRRKRGLPEKFLLYLGTIEPRKNLSTLITAFAKLRAEGIKLVCAGGRGWMYEVEELGYKYEMNDMAAALGLVAALNTVPSKFSSAGRMIEFVQSVASAMGLDTEVAVEPIEDGTRIVINGNNCEVLVTHKAAGLDALQHLVNAAFRREHPGRHIVVDCLDYRKSKDEELRQTALLLAERARTTGETQELGPLNPYARRIVHLAVAEDPTVSSESIGDAFLKTVLISV